MSEREISFDDLTVTEYEIKEEFYDLNMPRIGVRFCRMISPFYKGEKWAVRKGGHCLNKQGNWEYEPNPSSRHAVFYAKCRFKTLPDAIAVYNKRTNNYE